jgi:hypothetical protein
MSRPLDCFPELKNCRYRVAPDTIFLAEGDIWSVTSARMFSKKNLVAFVRSNWRLLWVHSCQMHSYMVDMYHLNYLLASDPGPVSRITVRKKR